MTLDDALVILNKIKTHTRNYETPRIVIPINTVGSAGASPSVNVKYIYAGFDWDNGKIFIQPEEQLRIVDTDEMKQLQDEYGKYGLLLYERDNLKKEVNKLRKEISKLNGE